jgi:hypothetical protein
MITPIYSGSAQLLVFGGVARIMSYSMGRLLPLTVEFLILYPNSNQPGILCNSEGSQMTAFRFAFDDNDDEGFELIEEEAEVNNELGDDDDESDQTNSDPDDVIWEVTED